MRTSALALLALLMTSCGAVEHVDRGAEYAAARQALVSCKDGAPGLGVDLDRAWSAVTKWTAGYLDEHPDATAEQLAKAVVELDPPRLRATAVRLSGAPAITFAVAANYPKSGVFFVVARTNDGRFHAVWNIKDIARRHYASRDEIGYWALTKSGWGDGPATGSIGPIPPSASHHARFFVDAVAAADAGGTFHKQFGVWEWNGAEAVPLFLESYQVSFDTGPVTVKDGDVSIPTKGSYKSFSTCGACPEPHVLWRLRVAPDGVHNLGAIDAEPEMRCVDELWDRVIHDQPVNGVAAAEVVDALRPIIREASPPGMVEESKITEEKGRRFLTVRADNVDRPLRFEVGSGSPCLRSVTVKSAQR
jgi:hypothetical protein